MYKSKYLIQRPHFYHIFLAIFYHNLRSYTVLKKRDGSFQKINKHMSHFKFITFYTEL